MTIVGAYARTQDLEGQDAYFSVDVETDGPIPGVYSMLSFGIVAAGIHDGVRYSPPDEGEDRYFELRPIEDGQADPEALQVNGLDRALLAETGLDPSVAMTQAREWILEHARGRRPVMVASPAGFDWMFMHWYFVKFAGSSPFGHSSCFDLKTMIAVKMNVPMGRASVKHLPDWLDGAVPRTHNALDDARNQAQVFSNVIAWAGGATSTGV